jgi:hypothetical protein
MTHFFNRFKTVLMLLILASTAQISLEGTQFRSQPWSCVLSTGDTITMWQVNDSDGNMYIECNIYSHTDNTWGKPTTISLPGQKALAPCITADNFGNGVVVYLGIDETNFNKYGWVTGYSTGFGWGPPIKIPTETSVVYQNDQPHNQMTVINSDKGSLFVGVWCGFDSGTNSVNIYSTTCSFSPTTGWGPLTTVQQISP